MSFSLSCFIAIFHFFSSPLFYYLFSSFLLFSCCWQAPCLVTWQWYSLMESLSECHHTHTHTHSAEKRTRLLIALQCFAGIAKLPPLAPLPTRLCLSLPPLICLCHPKQSTGTGQERTQQKTQGSKHNKILGSDNYIAHRKHCYMPTQLRVNSVFTVSLWMHACKKCRIILSFYRCSIFTSCSEINRKKTTHFAELL